MNQDRSDIKKMKLGMLLGGDIILVLMASILLCGAWGILILIEPIIVHPILYIPLSWFSFYICLCVVALLIPKLGPGIYSLSDKRVNKWFVGFIFGRIWNYEPIRYLIFSVVSMRWLFLKCLGAKIAIRSSISSDAGLYDVHLITIGEDSVIGMGSKLVPHYIVKGKLVLSPIEIGRNVQIGYNGTLPAGCRVGDDSQVEICVTFLPRTKLPKSCRIGHSSTIDNSLRVKEGEVVPPFARPVK